MLVNQVTMELKPYPMEELAKIRLELQGRSIEVFDFGTGDPKIPTWEPIREAIRNAIPDISQYPSVRAQPDLRDAIWGYINRRFGISKSLELDILPTNGAKEAIFSIALSLIGRNGKKILIYPDPGYPVYRSSALFSGGIPYPVVLKEEHGYLLEPWTLPLEVQKNTAAIWVNYPHNPTGAMAPKSYFEKILNWAQEFDVILLSDECYVDIYDAKLDTSNRTDDVRPFCPLVLSNKNVISFFSLSKRSGMTGYRSGAMVGDKSILTFVERARGNFGCGTPNFILAGAKVAWADDQHVALRRAIFTERIDLAFPRLKAMGLIDQRPDAAFYLWCKVPNRLKGNDIGFALELARLGIICQPSSWLGEGVKGYVRFALVPELAKIASAMEILEKHLLAVN